MSKPNHSRRLLISYAIFALLAFLAFWGGQSSKAQNPTFRGQNQVSGATPTPTPFTFVQAKGQSGTTVSFDSNVTAGNKVLLVVFPRGSSNPTVTSVAS